MVHWIIEDTAFDQDVVDRLKESVRNANGSCQSIKYYDLINGNTPPVPQDKKIVVYGSLNIASYIQNHIPWEPGPICNFVNFECTTYYNHYGKYLLNPNYVIMSVREAIRQKDWLFNHVSERGLPLFVRPVSGSKHFAGKCLDYKSWNEKGFEVGWYYDNDDILVIIAPAQDMADEYRLVVSREAVITGSSYKVNHRLNIDLSVPGEVIDFANKILQETPWKPDDFFVMDIGRFTHGSYKLIELNSFSCSGLYNCNTDEIMRSIEDFYSGKATGD